MSEENKPKVKVRSKDRKPGLLSNDDMQFIRDNVKTMGVPEIARALNRREKPIYKFMDREGLIEKESDDDAEDVEIKAQLMSENFWTEVLQQFSEYEVKYFASIWVSMVKQFQGDIFASEKLQLKKFITYEILRDRAMKANAMAVKNIEELDKNIRDEYRKEVSRRDIDAIKNWTTQVSSLRSSLSTYSRELNECSKEQNLIAKELKASRSDRVSNIQDAEKNWTSMIKLFQDDKVRKKIGQYIEVMRAAKDKEKKKLFEYHNYLDNRVDIPVLTSESVTDDYDGDR